MDFLASPKSSTILAGMILSTLIILSLIPSGLAIFCYDCNSVDDAECLDPFNKPQLLLVNCSILYPQATFCRKIDQTLHIDIAKKHRIFRKCAWEEHTNRRDCYNGNSPDYKAEICICRSDGCNQAPCSFSSPVIVLTATASLILAVRYLVAT